MLFKKSICALALGLSSLCVSVAAVADEWPLVWGDYWEVTGIDLKDGGGLAYSKWLATEWKENQEFAKSKGWIKDYMLLGNVYGRADEPDMYLITIRESIVSGAEGNKRNDEYMAWRKKTVAQMQAESGNRAEFREVMSSSLLQELNFRK